MNYEYRIYPNSDQAAVMMSWLDTCRRVYNYALAERKDWYCSRSCPIDACSIRSEYIIPADAPKPTYHNQALNLTKARANIPELGAVHSQVLQATLKQLDQAFVNMWDRGFGFPRFKRKMRSFVFPQFAQNPILGSGIKLPKIKGTIPIQMHRPIPDGFAVKQVRVVQKAKGWYVIVTIQADLQIPDIPLTGHAIGIDLGLNAFVATSDRELVDRPKFFVESQSKLKLLQRKLKHKQKGSKNWQKAQQKIAKQHQKINDTRKNYHFQVANRLCKNAGIIFAEDLNLKAMSRGMLCKHTLDAGFGQFLNILAWVCFKQGVYFAKVDAKGTSQTCPKCRAHSPKDLSIRIHKCDVCGYEVDRDIAAAEVILQRGLVAVGLTVQQPVEDNGTSRPEKQEYSIAKLGSPRYNALSV